jgi:hypothetical protein
VTTKTNVLYVNQNGRVVCLKHGGMYLETHVERHPDSVVIDTPLDNWILLDPSEVARARVSCEDC